MASHRTAVVCRSGIVEFPAGSGSLGRGALGVWGREAEAGGIVFSKTESPTDEWGMAPQLRRGGGGAAVCCWNAASSRYSSPSLRGSERYTGSSCR